MPGKRASLGEIRRTEATLCVSSPNRPARLWFRTSFRLSSTRNKKRNQKAIWSKKKNSRSSGKSQFWKTKRRQRKAPGRKARSPPPNTLVPKPPLRSLYTAPPVHCLTITKSSFESRTQIPKFHFILISFVLWITVCDGCYCNGKFRTANTSRGDSSIPSLLLKVYFSPFSRAVYFSCWR